MKQNWVIPLAAASVIVADTLSKRWALANLHAGAIQPFVPGILQLTLATNTGGAFGIAQNTGALMILLPTIICCSIIFWIIKRSRTGFQFSIWEQLGYGCVIGGAAGNIIERLIRGHVTDFLDFAFMSFPIFNVADSFIDIGIGLVVLHSLFSPSARSGENKEAPLGTRPASTSTPPTPPPTPSPTARSTAPAKSTGTPAAPEETPQQEPINESGLDQSQHG